MNPAISKRIIYVFYKAEQQQQQKTGFKNNNLKAYLKISITES